jgi:uncharacterized protein
VPVPVAVAARAVFRTPGGRLRLGWRLALFALLLVALAVVLAAFLPPTMTGQAVMLLAASLGAGWMLLGMEGRHPAALGFPLRRVAVRETLLGLALGCAVGAAAVAPIAAGGWVRWSLEPGTVAGLLSAGALSLWMLAPLAAAEEALLRGYPLQALSEAWGPAAALVLTSALFGLLHAWNPEVSWAGLVNTGVAGLFLGALYLRTGSLWWASGAHLGWNWVHGYLLDLPVSGLDVADQPYLEGRASGPELLSGGGFGPEGSLLATAVLLAATAWTWRTRRLHPSPAVQDAPPLARLVTRDPPRPNTPEEIT